MRVLAWVGGRAPVASWLRQHSPPHYGGGPGGVGAAQGPSVGRTTGSAPQVGGV